MADGRTLDKEQVLEKIQKVFQCYSTFTNVQFAFANTSFEMDDEKGTGLGHSEGMVKYNAVMENGEVIVIEGPFKLYMSCECNISYPIACNRLFNAFIQGLFSDLH